MAARVAALAGLLAVALGAFGAHGLSLKLREFGTVAIWEKAVLYHALHAVMLWMLARETPPPRGPWFCFLGGILIFSGSLYILAATNTRWLGAVTPVGGVCFVAGWLWLALGGIRQRGRS